MVAFIQLTGKGVEKHTSYSQNKMNVKVKMAGGGGGACLRLWHGTCPPPPHNTGQLHWQIALCGGGGEGEENN